MSPKNKPDPSAITLSRLPPHLAIWLAELPDCPEISSEAAEERLFPDPAAGEVPELTGDWKAFVQPELAELFRSSREVVRKDVEGLKQGKEGFSLTIPKNHFESWLGALNQVRLSLAEVHQLDENDLGPDEAKPPKSERDIAILKVHFFGYLQEMLVAAISGEDFSDSAGEN